MGRGRRRACLDAGNGNVDMIPCDLHILDPEFAELACAAMDCMLSGTWKPGMFRELDYVVN